MSSSVPGFISQKPRISGHSEAPGSKKERGLKEKTDFPNQREAVELLVSTGSTNYLGQSFSLRDALDT